MKSNNMKIMSVLMIGLFIIAGMVPGIIGQNNKQVGDDINSIISLENTQVGDDSNAQPTTSDIPDEIPPKTYLNIHNYYLKDNHCWVSCSSIFYLNSTDMGDNPSGVKWIKYRYDGINWITVSGDTAQFCLPDEGKYRLEWYAVDNNDNEEQKDSYDVLVDCTGPTTHCKYKEYFNKIFDKYTGEEVIIWYVLKILLTANDYNGVNDSTVWFFYLDESWDDDYSPRRMSETQFECLDYFYSVDAVGNIGPIGPTSNKGKQTETKVFDHGFPIRHSKDSDWGCSQSFTQKYDFLSSCKLYLRKYGDPEFDLTVELHKDHPQGLLIDAVTIPVNEISKEWSWVDIDFQDVSLTPGMQYYIVCPSPSASVTTSFGYEWGYAFGDQYVDGSFWFTRDGGGEWRDLPAKYEFAFCTYGYD